MLVNIDTPARLLRLLVLFSTRSTWSAQELTDRLEVTPRTLRRDVTRLRGLGYPIESTTGRFGGYALGAGGRLPPLLLDDDEAVAVTVGLRELSRTAEPVLGEAAVAALTKLVQVMPSALRERVDALGEVTVRLGWATSGAPDDEPTDVAVLMALAMACRRQERLRFDYRTGDERTGRRHVEPHRLVSWRNRWYLVAFDLDRDDWRTFRVDRIGPPAPTGVRSAERPVPDAAALVAEGVAVRVYDTQARVRLPVPPAVAAREISPTIGVIERGPADAQSTIVVIGGDADWIARYLAGLPFPFEVLGPDEVREEVAALGRRLLTRRCSLVSTETVTASEHDRLRPVGRADLGEDVGDVVAHRLRVDDEPAGDGVVVEPAGNQVEHVELAGAEVRERRHRRGAAELGELGDGVGQVAVEHDVAGHDAVQGVLDLRRIGALDDVAPRAVADRRHRRLVVLGHGEDDHLDVGMVVRQLPVHVEARPIRQMHVEQHDIGLGGRDQLGDIRCCGCLADQLDAVHLLERRGEAEAEDRVVVDDDDAHGGHATTSGRTACTRVPCGSTASTASVPPSSVARSRIAASPTPARRLVAIPTPSSVTSMST